MFDCDKNMRIPQYTQIKRRKDRPNSLRMSKCVFDQKE